MQQLDPSGLSLQGTALIEASAGTGKTFTLTTLVLRLLLERRLTIDQILVVTFTIAATEELRIKIAERLSDAISLLKRLHMDESAMDKPDPLLSDLLARHDGACALQLLSDAYARIDEAAIYTIDAFCNRVLQDQAFESGLPFRTEFIADDTPIRENVSRDFWRVFVDQHGNNLVARLVSAWRSPENLLKRVRSVLSMHHAVLLPELDLQQLNREIEAADQQYSRIRSIWMAERNNIARILREDKAINRGKYRATSIDKLLRESETCFSVEDRPAAVPSKFNLFTDEYLSTAIKKNQHKPEHDFFGACDGFGQLNERANKLIDVFIFRESIDYIRTGVDQHKRQHALLHFEDLRTRLDAVLQGGTADALASAIRSKWPVALVDEFQDTDPQQYRIFNRVFNHVDGTLFMIGDPKQAIYSFRGADIFTYLQARSRVNEFDQHTLGTNWRSDSRLVHAVNAIFERATAPFYLDHIHFHPVQAGPKADSNRLFVNGKSPPPLQFQRTRSQDEDRSGNQKDWLADSCAWEITRVLNLGLQGQATLGDRAVCASDIAVLVRSHSEARLVKNSLRRCGISSVHLGNDSVFQTDEASALVRLLRAVVRPGDLNFLRQALVCPLVGYNAEQLRRLDDDVDSWDILIDSFIEVERIWKSRGILAASLTLIDTLGIQSALLRRAEGEQKITNLLHLCELMQTRASLLPTPADLLLWLEAQVGDGSADEELLMRLESDDDLIRIVTIHKSKGLEYPLVFMPFLWSTANSRDKAEAVVFHHPDGNDVCCDLGSDAQDQHRELARREEFSESLRLLYVALTRAKNLAVIHWGVERDVKNSALAWLLHQRSAVDKFAGAEVPTLEQAQIDGDLASLADVADGCVAIRPMTVEPQRLQLQLLQPTSLQQQSFKGDIDHRWSVTSYTGLISGGDSERRDHDDSVTIDSTRAVESTEFDYPDQPDSGIFELPAGPRTGQLLHDIFEHLDFRQADSQQLSALIQEQLRRHSALKAGVDNSYWADSVISLVDNTIRTSLNTDGNLALNQIAATDRLNELEFHFSLNSVHAVTDLLQSALDSESGASVDTRRAASAIRITGLMRGFIDLVLRHDGKYYIVDYKSNWLGDGLQFYARANMASAIHSHHYNYQYLLYTVALHRYLSVRLQGYDYEQHFGGIYYLFLRGVRPGLHTGIWYDRPTLDTVRWLDAELSRV